MPRMAPDDARALDPKLAAFVSTSLAPSHGPLLQQASDSAIPTLANNVYSPPLSSNSNRTSYDMHDLSPAASIQPSYYDLSTTRSSSPMDPDVRGKKSWLAEAFLPAPAGTKRRPSISNMLRRKGSMSAASSRKNSVTQETAEPFLNRPPLPISEDPKPATGLDDIAATPTSIQSFSAMQEEVTKDTPRPLHRLVSESPAISTVIESGEDRSTVHITPVSPSAHAQTFIGQKDHEPIRPISLQSASSLSNHVSPASQKRSDVLARLETILALGPEKRPDVLDDPPRSLIASLPVLLVVNAQVSHSRCSVPPPPVLTSSLQTVKDRHIFLFSDILVIAKPLSNKEENLGMDGHFFVKHVVPLQQVKVDNLTPIAGSAFKDRDKQHPLVTHFIESFTEDPFQAIKDLLRRSELGNEPSTLASVLYKTPDLDREQLGHFLSHKSNAHLLKSFMERFPFRTVRIDDALRILLLSTRLSTSAVECENLLQALVRHWYQCNAGHSDGNAPAELVWQLVLAVMQLNDSLHPDWAFGFAFPNKAITARDFVQAFSAKDPQRWFSQDTLVDIYASIHDEPLMQSLSTAHSYAARNIVLSPKAPFRFQVNKWSEKIMIRIPDIDPGFEIRLHGDGLTFDRPVLRFEDVDEAGFRVMAATVGSKHIVFQRCGPNA